MSEFENRIHELDCVPFGSRQWGGESKYSDYDYAISLDNYIKLKREFRGKFSFKELDDKHYPTKEMFNVINTKIRDGNPVGASKIFNLVVYTTQEMVNQYTKINNIASKLGTELFQEKDARVKFCEAFNFLLLKPLWDEVENVEKEEEKIKKKRPIKYKDISSFKSGNDDDDDDFDIF